MNALLVSPVYRKTYWSMDFATPIIGAKAAHPPLGLLTVAAMLPNGWNLRLVDMNVSPLEDAHLDWADVLFISAMSIQAFSAEEVIQRARRASVIVVAGGAHYLHYYDYFVRPIEKPVDIDHFVLGEAEDLIAELARDLEQGTAREVYQSADFPDMRRSPIPRFDLVDPWNYYSMATQFTRGCPHGCDFCDVTILNGRRPRYKQIPQCLTELDAIRATGWKGGVFIVDDNFIGNPRQTKALLRELIDWQDRHGHPFFFYTQASIKLADDPELMGFMVRARFKQVFLGIETPSGEALEECSKSQNRNRDLVKSVHAIQGNGMEVMAGFIVGFDADTPDIFQRQRDFIEEAAIPLAMVGLLCAIPDTGLWERLGREGRLRGVPSGDNACDFEALNFIPIMGRSVLLNGYRNLLAELYSPKASYGRIKRFMDHYSHPGTVPRKKALPREMAAIPRLFWKLGVVRRGRLAFWSLFFHVLRRKAVLLPKLMTMAAMVNHCQIITRRFLRDNPPVPVSADKR